MGWIQSKFRFHFRWKEPSIWTDVYRRNERYKSPIWPDILIALVLPGAVVGKLIWNSLPALPDHSELAVLVCIFIVGGMACFLFARLSHITSSAFYSSGIYLRDDDIVRVAAETTSTGEQFYYHEICTYSFGSWTHEGRTWNVLYVSLTDGRSFSFCLDPSISPAAIDGFLKEKGCVRQPYLNK